MTEVVSETALIPREIASIIGNLEQAGAITPVSLDLTDVSMPYEQWENFGRALGAVGRAASFWIGDWLIFGESIYGEDHAQAIEPDAADRYELTQRVTGLAHQTLLNASSVCRRVPRERRRSELTFGHHAVVAPLEPAEQIEWLQRAIDEAMSVSDLRAAIRAAKSPGAEIVDDDESGPSDGTVADESIDDRLDAAATAVYVQAQATGRGVFEVPDPAIHALGAALGRE